ncbi:hypothetical protein GT037_004327 [Alternaria burnsii]|uniref:Uncharacterized protein n=1 Tax=Alternaria burnsii TaxID=1187904 RepID=A0A8H7EGC4_9PLEO|nr:uncharacterized protein GT037_004327 [Alternaria burnsii]KAF7677468.1 hypothetical protein GT037_004327 [Alternaria burnsii]
MTFTQSSDTSGRLNYAGSGTDLKRVMPRRGCGPRFIHKPTALRESGNIGRTSAKRSTDTCGDLRNTLDLRHGFLDDQAGPAKIDHAAEKEPTIKESDSVLKKRAFKKKEARAERNAKNRIFGKYEEQVMNEVRTAKEKTNIRVTRSVTKRRAATKEQMKLGEDVMFTVQQAIAIYERQEKDGFPLDL